MGTPAGWKDFTSTILTTSDVNNYLMSQTVMVFASAAARTSGLGTPNEGNLTYLKDSNSFWYYDGSSWINMGNVMVFASSAARATAIPAPVEGMLTWLGDVDELEVYNGTSWLRVVVTSDDEGLTVTGDVFANTGKLIANRANATSGSSQGGVDFRIDGSNYGQIFMSNSSTMRFTSSANTFDGSVATGGAVTSSGNVTVSKRNPVLRVEETGGTDNVDIELAQTGVALTGGGEGLRIRYESGTGHSRITNVYGLGDLYLHSANNTGTGLRIASNGFTYNNLGDTYTNSGQMIGSARLVAQGYVQTSSTFNVGAAWVTLISFTVNPAIFNASWLGVHFEYSCYMSGTGAHRSRILVDRGGTYSVYERYRYFNTAYQHQQWAQNQITNVPNSGGNYSIYCQVIGFTTISFDSNDSYGFVAYTA